MVKTYGVTVMLSFYVKKEAPCKGSPELSGLSVPDSVVFDIVQITIEIFFYIRDTFRIF